MEVCSLRDAATEFADIETEVFGISLDDVATQKDFHKTEKLNFSLLSDPDGSVARKYGVLMPQGYAGRVSFVIDTKGKLRAIVNEVNVRSHGTDLVDMVRELQFTDD